jgi:hypothetical protein
MPWGKALLCRLHPHKYRRMYNDQDRVYRLCERCGHYADAMTIMDHTNPDGKGIIG